MSRAHTPFAVSFLFIASIFTLTPACDSGGGGQGGQGGAGGGTASSTTSASSSSTGGPPCAPSCADLLTKTAEGDCVYQELCSDAPAAAEMARGQISGCVQAHPTCNACISGFYCQFVDSDPILYDGCDTCVAFNCAAELSDCQNN